MPIKNTTTLNKYFAKEKIADIVASLPAPDMTLTNMLFPVEKRIQKTSPFISIEDIEAETGAVPLVTRGSQSLSVDDVSKTTKIIEVDPISISKFVHARDINDLMAYGEATTIDAYIAEKIQYLRDRVSSTTETLVRQALSGKIEYPYATASGTSGKCEITLGTPKTIATTSLLATAKLGVLQRWLESLLQQHMINTGSMGKPVFFMGSAVYDRVVEIVVSAGSIAPAKWTDEGVILFGKYDIRAIAMTYVLPGSTTVHDVIASNKVRIIDLSNIGKLMYAALDDLDANLAPLPFYAKPIYKQDPDGVKIVGESKPLPAFNMAKQSEQTVTLTA